MDSAANTLLVPRESNLGGMFCALLTLGTPEFEAICPMPKVK
jgi:hypothetical protein